MVLPVHFEYIKEEQAGSNCVTFVLPSLTEVAQAPGYFVSMVKAIHESKRRIIFWHIWASVAAD